MRFPKHRISLALLFAIFSFFIHAESFLVDYNESEQILIHDKSQIKVLVSSNNFPYEYLNNKNEPAGIHVEYIKKILSLTNHKQIVFITDVFSEDRPDIVSSFSKREQLKFKTDILNIYEIYFLYQASHNEVDLDRFIILNKEYLYDHYSELFPDKKFFITDDLLNALNLMYSEKQSAIIFDCFNYETMLTIKKLHNNHNIDVQKNYSIQFFLSTDNAHLYNILTKNIRYLNEKNVLYDIYNSFLSQNKSKVLYRNYYTVIISVFSGIVVLMLIILVLIYIYRVFGFRLENTVNAYKKRNTELKSEVEKLVIQIETFKLDNNNFLGNINCFAFIMDIQGNILFINHYCRILLGFEPEALIGHNIEELVSIEHKQRLLNVTLSKDSNENRVVSNFDGDSYLTNEIDINSKEGPKKTFIFSTHFNVLSEKYTQIFCILHDISDRKQIKNQNLAYSQYLDDIVQQRLNALKESEEQFKFVIDSAYDCIFTIKDYVFTLVNEAFYTMTGWSSDKVKDKMTNFYDIIDPDDRRRVKENIERNLEKQINHFILNTKIIKFDGTLSDVEIHFSSIFSKEENRILGIIHDIAQKIEYENQRLQMEKLSTISTVAVTTNDQINSPLNAIQGYVELLENQTIDPKPVQLKAYKNIYDSVAKIKRILQKLVAFTNDPKNINFTTAKYNYGDYDMLSLEKEKKIDEE